MGKRGYIYALLAALLAGMLLGFTFGGVFIDEKKPASAETPEKTEQPPEDLYSRQRSGQAGSSDRLERELPSSGVSGVEERVLLEGTQWETSLFIIRGEQPDPKMLVLGGVHGDEPAAYWSGDAAGKLRLRKGTLYVIPHLNEVARMKGTREGLGDINRKFPGNPSGDPEQRLCWEVTKLIREEGIKMVLTFHEALGFHSEPPYHPGQTLYYDWDVNPYAGTPLTSKANQIIRTLNARIAANPRGYREKELFTTHVDPIPTSATYELMRGVGVDYAFGCEVCKNNERERRVWFHLAALTSWMELEGFVIENWAEVERNIWSGLYTAI